MLFFQAEKQADYQVYETICWGFLTNTTKGASNSMSASVL